METAFNTADTAKTAYDTEETRLKGEVTRLAADGDATDAQKNAAQTALDDHKATKAGIISAFETAKTERDEKDTLLKNAAKQREDDAYAAEKAERDTKFIDLEAQKMDEEAQRDDLIEQLNKWKKNRAEAAIGDDDEYFNEMHAQVVKA